MDIQTQRLVLRQLRKEDAVWITEEIAKPEVHRWLTSVPYPYGLVDGQIFVEKFGPEPGVRVICHEGAPIGVVSLIPANQLEPSRPAVSELGYWLMSSAWGGGLMTEAAQAMINWFFAHHDGPIGSGWIKGNARSERVLAKLGFRPTGETVPRRSHFEDADVPVVRVALTKPPATS